MVFSDNKKLTDRLSRVDMILLEVIDTQGPVTFLAPSLAVGLAPLKGTSQPIPLPDNDVVANVVIMDNIVCYTGQMARCAFVQVVAPVSYSLY